MEAPVGRAAPVPFGSKVEMYEEISQLRPFLSCSTELDLRIKALQRLEAVMVGRSRRAPSFQHECDLAPCVCRHRALSAHSVLCSNHFRLCRAFGPSEHTSYHAPTIFVHAVLASCAAAQAGASGLDSALQPLVEDLRSAFMDGRFRIVSQASRTPPLPGTAADHSSFATELWSLCGRVHAQVLWQVHIHPFWHTYSYPGLPSPFAAPLALLQLCHLMTVLAESMGSAFEPVAEALFLDLLKVLSLCAAFSTAAHTAILAVSAVALKGICRIHCSNGMPSSLQLTCLYLGEAVDAIGY